MNKQLPIFWLAFLSILLNLLLLPSSDAAIHNLSLEHLSVEDGLSQGSIHDIIQDKTGFIWLATDNGVNIYDGNKVKQLKGPDDIFRNTAIYNLLEDKEGCIWLNVDGKSLYRYNPKTDIYQLISPPHTTKKNNLLVSLYNDDDYIWILSSKSLNRYTLSNGKYQQILDLQDELPDDLSLFHMTINHHILYMASKAGTFALNINTNHWRKLPPVIDPTFKNKSKEPNKIYTVNTDNNNTLYLGSYDGIFSVNIENITSFIQKKSRLPKYQSIIKNTGPWCALLDKNSLYFATNRGLYVIDTRTQKGTYLFGFSDYFNNMTNDNISALIKDNQGNFWLGSQSLGVYKWDPTRELIQNFGYKKNNANSLSYNEVWDIIPSNSHENSLWVGTTNGLNLVDVKSQQVKQFLINKDSKIIYSESYIYQIIPLSPEKLLLSSPQGAYLFNTLTEKRMPLNFSDDVNQLLKKEQYGIFKENDILWLKNKQGVFKVNLQTNEIDTLPEITKIFSADKELIPLGSLPNSDLFLFSSNDSLWGFNKHSRKFSQLYTMSGIAEGEYLNIDNWTIDKHHILWLSFSGRGLVGLSLPDFKQKYFYHKGNSIIDNNVYSVMTDKDGDIWFSTHNGIFMLNTDTQHLSHFTTNNGFSAAEFNGRTYARLSDRYFVYGSMEGISIFDPLVLKKNQHQDNFHVAITNFNVLSRNLTLPLILDRNITLPLHYDDVGIRLDFSTFSFSGVKNVLYEYSLSGKNNILYPLSTEPNITFPNLASGETVFTIRAKSPSTGEYSKPIHIKFVVSYAPWFSPLAYCCYFIILFILIFWWYKYRKTQQQLLLDAHEQVKFRENRLQLALTGSNSEVWDWQAEDNILFGKRLTVDLGYENKALFYSFDEHVALIHPEDKNDFISNWQLFINNANLTDNFNCTYRLKSKTHEWLWYKDLGKIVAVDTKNHPTRVTGSYTNITESRANEERAQYYGDAFKQTQDWVFIVNEKVTRVTVNQSMREVFGWQEEEFDFNSSLLGIPKDRRSFYYKLLGSLDEGDHWRGEELISTTKGDSYHVIINITIGRNSVTRTLHYLFVLTDISAQKTAENELRMLANYDHLTGLPNRSLLLERIKHAIAYSNRQNKSIALFFIDLDKFKQVNDSLGHDNGDILLQKITQRLVRELRGDDTLARLGGDEFVVLLESFTNNHQLGHIAQKIIDSIAQPVTLGKNVVSVGASVGISLYPDDAINSEMLLRNADVAMYNAKQSGRNTLKFFTQQMNIEANSRLEKESKIKLAVKNEEFINHYQPIVDAYTGKAVGVEMLMRWQTPNELIPPDEFIPLAEELDLIIPMTEVAILRALNALKEWHTVRPNFYLSINLSAKHFAKDDLVDYFSTLLAKFELPANILRIEVTESTLILEPVKTISTMCELSALGVTLLLDDFGTGFSSLSYLKELPLDIIKIDHSFISGIGINDTDEAIIDSTLVLAERLKMQCIAEGVETKNQLQYLTDKHCHYIQGYLYSKPITANEVMKLLLINETDMKVTRSQ